MNEIVFLVIAEVIVGVIMYSFAWYQAWHFWGKKLKALHKEKKEK